MGELARRHAIIGRISYHRLVQIDVVQARGLEQNLLAEARRRYPLADEIRLWKNDADMCWEISATGDVTPIDEPSSLIEAPRLQIKGPSE